MPQVAFTHTLQRHVDCPRREAPGGTVHEVLEAVFSGNPRVRGYVLDDQGAVRKHIVIFVNGRPIHDRQTLSDPLAPDADVYVMQALSGG